MVKMPERQLRGLDDLGGTLDDIISRSLGDALAAQNGTSTQHITAQIQQSTPFHELIKQIADEIKQQGTQVLDTPVQQAINTFGTSSSTSIPRQSTSKTTKTTHDVEIDATEKKPKSADESTTNTQPEKNSTEPANKDTSQETNKSDETGEKPALQEEDKETPTDETNTPSVGEEDDTETEPIDNTVADTNTPTDENTITQQQIQHQHAQQQQTAVAMISSQQLKNQLAQLQQQKKTLQKKLLDEQDTAAAFGIDQAVLFIPALTTIAYIVDFVDFTELLAPFLDMTIALISAYWRMTRSARLKLFYLKKLPGFIFARVLGMIPFVSYISPELIEEVKTLIQRLQKARKATKMLPSTQKQIKLMDKQIAQIQKQLSSQSIFSNIKNRFQN